MNEERNMMKPAEEPVPQPMVEAQEKLFCRKCGTELFSDSVFCHKCGTGVIK